MTVDDYIKASESDVDLRRALAADPEKLAAALQIVARARRLDPDGAAREEEANGDD